MVHAIYARIRTDGETPATDGLYSEVGDALRRWVEGRLGEEPVSKVAPNLFTAGASEEVVKNKGFFFPK